MYYFYRKYRLIYYLSAIAMFLLVLIALPAAYSFGTCYNIYGMELPYGSWLLQSGTVALLFILCFVIIAYAAAFLSSILSMLHFGKTLKLLYADLDPAAFLADFEPDIQKFRNSRFRTRILPYIYYVQVLKENGEIDKALAVFSEISSYKQLARRKFSGTVAVLYSELWSAYHTLGDTDGEKLFKEKFFEAVNLASKNKRAAKNSQGAELIAFLSGDYEKAKSLYLEIAENPKSANLSKLRAHCRTAEIYALQGDEENAREQLSFARKLSDSIFTYTSSEALVENILQSKIQ